MKVKINYSKSTFYVSLVILVLVLFMAYQYISSVGQYSIQPTIGFCGDGVCSGSENYSTCPQDCCLSTALNNGDFNAGLSCWSTSSEGGGGQYISYSGDNGVGNIYSIIYAMRGRLGILYQDFSVSADAIEYDVKVDYQWLDCRLATLYTYRYPAGVQITYLDDAGNANIWWRGYYYLGTNCDGNGTQVTQGVWMHEIINLTDFAIPPKTITEIELTAGGWDFNTSFDNVVLWPPNAPPVAVLTADKATAVTDENIVFDGSSSYDLDGTITHYSWLFGDEASINPPNDNPTIMAIVPITKPVEPIGDIRVHSYSSAGTYEVILTVTDDNGATSQTSMQIVVSEPSQPVQIGIITVSAGADKSVYVGDQINFEGFVFCSAEPCNTISSYSWDFTNDGTADFTSATTGNTTHTYNTLGTFTAVFTATDNETNVFSDEAIITIISEPTTTPVGGGGGGTGIVKIPPLGGAKKNETTVPGLPPAEMNINRTPEETIKPETKVNFILIDAIIALAVIIATSGYYFYRNKKTHAL